MSTIGMILEIVLPLLKKKAKKDFHSKFGTMTCEFGKEDQYFYWHIYTDRFNKNKYSTSLLIEGNQIRPDEVLLDNASKLLVNLKDYTNILQRELDIKFPSKSIDLKKDYKVEEIEFSLEGKLEIEYSTNEQDIVNVVFIGNTIQKLELY